MFNFLFRGKDRSRRAPEPMRKRNLPPPQEPDWGFGKKHPSRR